MERNQTLNESFACAEGWDKLAEVLNAAHLLGVDANLLVQGVQLASWLNGQQEFCAAMDLYEVNPTQLLNVLRRNFDIMRDEMGFLYLQRIPTTDRIFIGE